jgi:hypothetical protein
MEPDGSFSCWQEPSIRPYPEPDQSNAYQPILLLSNIHYKIINSTTSFSS